MASKPPTSPEADLSTEDEIFRTVNSYWLKADEDNRNWLERARTGYQYFLGNQWDPNDLSTLDAHGRPHLTINRVLPIINLLSGVQRQNRKMVKVFPRSGGTRQVAKTLTELVKHAHDVCNGDWELSLMFVDGLITGKGWLGYDIDYSDDPINGDLVIRKESPFAIFEDREAIEYDLNKSAKFVIKREWVDHDALVLRYPKKEVEIEAGGRHDRDPNQDDVQSQETDDYQDEASFPDKTQHKKYRKRIRTCYHKRWEKVTFLMNRTTLEVTRVHEANVEMAKSFVQTGDGNWDMRTRISPVLYRTVTLGQTVLQHVADPFDGLVKFPYVRFTPFLLDDNIMGVVDNLVSPQQELNKRRSQALHHLNQSANSGWIGDRDALPDSEWQNLEEFGAKPGVIIKKKPNSTLSRIGPESISQGHLALGEMGADDMENISGVNPNLQGRELSSQESGKLSLIRQRQGMQVNEPIFDNFSYSRQIAAEILLDLIRRPIKERNGDDRRSKLYSDEEIAAVIEDSGEQMDMSQLGSFAIGRYGIRVTLDTNLPTVRMAGFEAMLEAAQAGLAIPPKFLIKHSELPEKDEIIQALEAQEQAQAKAAQQAQELEEVRIVSEAKKDLAQARKAMADAAAAQSPTMSVSKSESTPPT